MFIPFNELISSFNNPNPDGFVLFLKGQQCKVFITCIFHLKNPSGTDLDPK
jgi:hypothetical protein